MKRPARVPVVLTEAEVRAVLAQRDGRHALLAGILYGAGLRLMECVRLRVKDVDFGYSQITVRDGKGEKDRIAILPALLQAKPLGPSRAGQAMHQRVWKKASARGTCPSPSPGSIRAPGGSGGWQYLALAPSRAPCYGVREIDEEGIGTMATIATPVTTRHRLTVADFHRMADVGIFQEDDRVELIEGEIIDMAPIGSGHAGTVMALNRLLARALGDRAIVLVQSPVVLPEHSEPEPDLALLRPREDFYRSGHPLPGDILLIIEVADTRLAYDRDVKIPLYARHGIPEVWLVDLEDRRLHIYTSPSASGYLECRILAAPGMLVPAELQGCPVDLSGLFP